MQEQHRPEMITTARAARRQLRGMAADPSISPETANQLMDSHLHRVWRTLLGNPSCPGHLLLDFANKDALTALRNPAFELYCVLEPRFLDEMSEPALCKLVHCREAPPGILACAAHRVWRCCESRESRETIVRAILDHPNATEEIRASLPEVTSRQLYAPFSRRVKRLHRGDAARFVADELKVASPPAPGDQLLLSAMAMHGLISGSCAFVATVVCAAGVDACIAMLLHHPALSRSSAKILTTSIARGCSATQLDELCIGTPGARRSHKAVQARLMALWRSEDLWSRFPEHCFHDAASRFDAAEVAVLAMRAHHKSLPVMLLLSSPRCPLAFLDRRSRCGYWLARMAAALNPHLHPTTRASLATRDPNALVRLVAARPTRTEKGVAPIPSAAVIKRRLPPVERRRLAKLRRDLASTPRIVTRHLSRPRLASSLPRWCRRHLEEGRRAHTALEAILGDARMARLISAGVHDYQGKPAILSTSPLHGISATARGRWIASEVLLRRSARPSMKAGAHA